MGLIAGVGDFGLTELLETTVSAKNTATQKATDASASATIASNKASDASSSASLAQQIAETVGDKFQVITSLNDLKSYTAFNFVHYDNSSFERKSGNVTGDDVDIIRVDSNYYWQRVITSNRNNVTPNLNNIQRNFQNNVKKFDLLLIGDSNVETPERIFSGLQNTLDPFFDKRGGGWLNFAGTRTYGASNVTLTGAWASVSFLNSRALGNSQINGTAGMKINVSGYTDTINYAKADNLDFYYFDDSAVFSYKLNGGSAVTVSATNSGLAKKLNLSFSARTDWSLEIEVISGTLKAYGLNFYQNIDGLLIHKCGVSGTTSSSWVSCIDTAEWRKQLQLLNPQAVCLLLGTNDKNTSIDIQTTEDNFNRIVKSIQTAIPTIDILIIGPNDDDLTAVPISTDITLDKRLSDISVKNKVGFLSLFQLNGDFQKANAAGIFNSDKIHFSTLGSKLQAKFILNKLFNFPDEPQKVNDYSNKNYGTVKLCERPEGGYYFNDGGVTGAIKIVLPAPMIVSVMKFTVEIWNYGGGNNSQTLIISGTNGGGGWANTNSNVITNKAINIPVRFGYDSSLDRAVVYLGDLTTNWGTHLSILIRDFAFTNTGDIEVYKKNWALSLETTAFANVTSTLSPFRETQLYQVLSTAQINAISSPARGLTIYNITIDKMCYYNGSSWQVLTSTAM